MAETGAGASCASLAHVSSMAASTLDADLMVTDDDADVELTCASDAHEAPTPVSAISRGRGGRWQRVPAWTVAMSRSALNHLSGFCTIYS